MVLFQKYLRRSDCHSILLHFWNKLGEHNNFGV